jgi:hypothetical protein
LIDYAENVPKPPRQGRIAKTSNEHLPSNNLIIVKKLTAAHVCPTQRAGCAEIWQTTIHTRPCDASGAKRPERIHANHEHSHIGLRIGPASNFAHGAATTYRLAQHNASCTSQI